MILVLPGSHNKFVAVNADKEITGCLTSISGELLSAIIPIRLPSFGASIERKKYTNSRAWALACIWPVKS